MDKFHTLLTAFPQDERRSQNYFCVNFLVAFLQNVFAQGEISSAAAWMDGDQCGDELVAVLAGLAKSKMPHASVPRSSRSTSTRITFALNGAPAGDSVRYEPIGAPDLSKRRNSFPIAIQISCETGSTPSALICVLIDRALSPESDENNSR